MFSFYAATLDLFKSCSLAVMAILLLTSAGARADEKPAAFSFGGYMRAASGDNNLGGKQACFNNPGTVGNEFRLGNECGIYGEATFRAHVLKGEKKTDPYFLSQLTLAYFPAADSQYEDSDIDADKRDINVVEAYVEGGNLDGMNIHYWAGKRFYRAVDIHMNDFFYFGNMSGTGGGVGGIDTGAGFLDVAIIRESALVTTGAPAVQSRVDSSVGPIGKTALDLQLGSHLSDLDETRVWAVAAYSPPAYSQVTNASYEAGRGFVGGVYYRRKLEANGFNDVSVSYGTGIMQSLEMGTAVVLDGSGGNGANRLRVTEHLTRGFGPRFQTHFAATYEDRDSGASADAKSRWWNVGVRPFYVMSEHFHLVAEAGHSEVRDDADRSVAGSRIGARTLNRVTFAPEVGIKSDIFGRPVIRFFVTHSMWNDDNRAFKNGTATKSVAGYNAFTTESSGTSVGFQSEVWF